jgi:hypothetical protein
MYIHMLVVRLGLLLRSLCFSNDFTVFSDSFRPYMDMYRGIQDAIAAKHVQLVTCVVARNIYNVATPK